MDNLIFPKQRKNESNSHYSLFKWYCTLGSKRSIKRFINESNKSETFLNDVAKRNDWTARTNEFDQIQNENVYQQSESEKKTKRSKYIDVLLQIQAQLLETTDHISKLKQEEIFNEEDDIDTKMVKSTRILKYYAKFLDLSEKIDRVTDNLFSIRNIHKSTISEIELLQAKSKKITNSLQISANTAENLNKQSF